MIVQIKKGGKMSKSRYLLIVLFLVLSMACSLGREVTTEAPATTVPTETSASGEVAQAQPTMTPAPAVSSGGCSLNAAYVADVTIPDNTVVQPGASFTKVWRMRNSGTCDWEAGTQLVFVAGEPMTAIGAVAVPAVAKGATTDVSVEMTAPTTPGTYKSVWQLQAPNGQRFGNQIYVQIVVPAPATPTPTPVPPTAVPPTETPFPTFPPMTLQPQPTLNFIPTLPPAILSEELSYSSRGQVYADGSVIEGVSNCGDTSDNLGLEGFVTYDLHGLPAGITVLSAYFYWPNYDTLGSPFTDLGCMRAYLQDYGTLDEGDYVHPPVLGAVARYCSTTEIDNASTQQLESNVLDTIAARAGNGIIQFRFQFNERETNGDGGSDAFRGAPRLVISYQP